MPRVEIDLTEEPTFDDEILVEICEVSVSGLSINIGDFSMILNWEQLESLRSALCEWLDEAEGSKANTAVRHGAQAPLSGPTGSTSI